MTLEEALSECVQGARITAAHMQPGCYVEHSFSRGFLRCWPVDKPELEPNRTQCDFRASELDEAADWSVVERPRVDSWGKPLDLKLPNDAGTFVPCACGSRIAAVYCCGRPERAPSVPWGDLKLNTERTKKTAQPNDIALDASAVVDRLHKTFPDDMAALALKRDSWGRPIG